MKAVVTGGAGFIGSNLSRRLLREGHEVHVVDDLSLGFAKNIPADVTFHEGTILDTELLDVAMEGADAIFHQAALPSVPRSIEHPLQSHEANSTGSLTVLEAARRNDVGRVVMASSSSVYGDATESPKHEGLRPAPLSPYAVSKLSGEEYARVYHHLHGLNTVCLRYFNVYGPYQNPDGAYAAAIPKFIRAAMAGEPITVFGDGEQSRDFTFVDDVVSANLLAAKSIEGAGMAFNIGAAASTTVNDMIRIILDLVGSTSKIVKQPIRPGDVKHSLASIDSAKENLGFEPSISIEEGLQQTVAWMQENSGYHD